MNLLEKIGAILHADARFVESLLQQTESTEMQDTPIKKQGGEGRVQKRIHVQEFRVWLRTDKRGVSEIKPTLTEALAAAFKGLGEEIPKQIQAELSAAQ